MSSPSQSPAEQFRRSLWRRLSGRCRAAEMAGDPPAVRPAASIAALRMKKPRKSARNSRADHFVLRCPAPGARSFAPPGAVWFCPGAKVFALPGAVCCWPGAVPVPTCPGAVLDFPFVCAITGKLNRATKSTKAAMRIMICSMHVGPATVAKSPPRTRRVCESRLHIAYRFVSSIHQQLKTAH